MSDYFVPYLSQLFKGPYKSWYFVNKERWRTWREFSQAFRYEWGVKKGDADWLLEIRDLELGKSETLAEFAYCARFIFEQMQHPPEFKEQLQQILTKFNPRLTFEILNLSLTNYRNFLHYVSERNYLYRRVVDSQPSRAKIVRSKLNCMHENEQLMHECADDSDFSVVESDQESEIDL